jgi:hypothetical protein
VSEAEESSSSIWSGLGLDDTGEIRIRIMIMTPCLMAYGVLHTPYSVLYTVLPGLSQDCGIRHTLG